MQRIGELIGLTVASASLAGLVGSCAHQQAAVLPVNSVTAVSAPRLPTDRPEGLAPDAGPGDVFSIKAEVLPSMSASSWLIQYRSTDALGGANVVSGTVMVPLAPWLGRGPRPIVAFAHETVGVTDDCAPSKDLVSGTYLETGYVKMALAKGWAVALTDYEGLGMPGNHTYSVVWSEAHAVLDSVRAAIRLPGSGLDRRAPVAIWGYSQGGGAAAAAAEAAPSYAPELEVKGVAAGGTPANLDAVAAHLDGSLAFGFLAAAALGLGTAYPELGLDGYLNAAGQREFSAIASGTKSACIVGLLTTFATKHISDYTTSNLLEVPMWQARIRENELGLHKPRVPVFLYHGDIDEVIPAAVGAGLRDRWCAQGATVQWKVYPFGEHLLTQAFAAADAVRWIADRFDGLAASSTCP
jgi:pimeloyl-ACP methyl ester carboxylesterase